LGIDEQQMLLEDWVRGQSFLNYIIRLKFSFYEALPHSVLVLGHQDSEVAKTKLQTAYLQFLAAPDVQHHHYVMLLFSPASPLFEQVQVFLATGDVSADLEALAGACVFCTWVHAPSLCVHSATIVFACM
jgi:hypothetical protein